MSFKRRAIALTLLLFIIAVGTWRLLPVQPALPVSPCPNPVGVQHGDRTVIVCPASGQTPLDQVLRLAGLEACEDAPAAATVLTGQLVRYSSGCRIGPATGRLRLILGAPLDLNRATAEDLIALPRIGPTKAEQIVAHRAQNGPYGRVEELQQVKGIGPATIRALRPLVTVGAFASAAATDPGASSWR